MSEYRNAFEYLELLKAQNSKEKQSFESLKRYLSAKATKQGIPTNGTFELTPLCNFNCGMCYTHLSKEQLHGRCLLTINQWKDLMYDAWKAGMMYADLTGGECLTYPGFEELYLYLQSLGILINVFSNGALMDEHWIRFFRDHKPAQIQITLYGGDEETYERVTGWRGYSLVTEAIRRLIAEDVPLKIVVTPSRYMGEGVFKAIRAAASFGVPFGVNTMLINPKEETGRSGQQHDLSMQEYARIFQFLNELKGIKTHRINPELLPDPGGPCHECSHYGMPCKGGRASFTIEWDGKMHPCSSIRDIQADVLNVGFQTAWDDIRFQCQRWPNIPECTDCPYQAVCTPCPSMKAQFAGLGRQPLALCERTKFLVECGVRDLPECY